MLGEVILGRFGILAMVAVALGAAGAATAQSGGGDGGGGGGRRRNW